MIKQLTIILALLIVVFTLITLYLQSNPAVTPNTNKILESAQPTPSPIPATMIVTSKDLKFSVQTPNDWQMNGKNTFVDLNSDNGKIHVTRIATNFDNINDYLNDFDSKRQITVSSQNNTILDVYTTSIRTEQFNGGPIQNQKVYYIFIKGWIYSLSTSAQPLYDELDQVAKTFKYLP